MGNVIDVTIGANYKEAEENGGHLELWTSSTTIFVVDIFHV